VHDVILMYSRSEAMKFNPLDVPADKAKMPHTLITRNGKKFQTYELTGAGVSGGESGQPWRGFDPTKMGRHWAQIHATMDAWDAADQIHWAANNGWPRRIDTEPFDEATRRVAVTDVWTDIDRINQAARERLRYPTQKPVALLERIIAASSDPDDVVLDPFCGCGTAVDAAQRLGRRWIGIDITTVAIEVIKDRLRDQFSTVDYVVRGEPTTVEEAVALADLDKHEFQRWALERVGVTKPVKKGADRGIDGEIVGVLDDDSSWRCIISVKGGGVNVSHVRDLRGTIAREGADIGVLISLKRVTRPMEREAADAGFISSGHARIQIVTVEQLLDGKQLDLPARTRRRLRIVG
jgi:hypothetical protein